MANFKVKELYNATIVTGSYIDKQGAKKNKYLTIGTLFIFDGGGMSLKLDALPITPNQSINFYPQNKGNN